MTILITGGAGFIGSAVVRKIMGETAGKVVNVDKLTYAGSLATLGGCLEDPRHVFLRLDIADRSAMKEAIQEHQPSMIMHLAAESHVDRSIDGPSAFINTNIFGTYALLEVATEYWKSLGTEQRRKFRFHHVSTDEVYGSLGPSGLFTEETPYKPNSPYSASKAASDHLVRAWNKTYGLPTVISNCSNNYGPYQHPEKLIPLMIHKSLSGADLPVYGSGENVRDWIYVEDHADALLLIAKEGVPGEVYNVGGGNEVTNIRVVKSICNILDELAPAKNGESYAEQIRYVEDRPGHDMRYAIDSSKIKRELDWTPNETFETGLRKTVEWYLSNREWLVPETGYKGERLGLRA